MDMNDEKKIKEEKPSKETPKKKLPGWAITLIALLSATVLAVCGFSAYALSYQKVLPNVYVEDLKLGGLSKEEALREISLLDDEMEWDREVVFSCGENVKTVTFSELDLRGDCVKIAEDAFAVGRKGTVFERIIGFASSFFNKTGVPFTLTVNERVFDSTIKQVAGEFEIPMTETTYEVVGDSLVVIKGEEGMMVNRDKVRAELGRRASDKGDIKLDLAIEKADPKTVDIDHLYDDLTGPVRDAKYEYKNGDVIVVPHKPQVTVDKGELKKALETDKKRYTIKVKAIQPEVTTEELEELLFRDVLGQFSSNFSSSTASRASNVSLTAQRINDYVLMPGDVFSYDKTVGRRTIANGYKEAGVYVGNKVESGVGGGICQTSSTLYSAALYANLEIVERTSHSLPVSYVPAGQDATIAEGYIDLKIRNNTEYPVKIVAVVAGRDITCKILGVKTEGQIVEIQNYITGNFAPQVERTASADIPLGYKQVMAKGAPGYSVSSKRIVKQGGKVVSEEKLTSSVYRAAPIEEVVNPADMKTPSDQLKIYDEEEYKKEQEAQDGQGEDVPDEERSPENQGQAVPEDEEIPEVEKEDGEEPDTIIVD